MAKFWRRKAQQDTRNTQPAPMPSQLRARQILPPGRGRRMCRGCHPRPFGKPKTT